MLRLEHRAMGKPNATLEGVQGRPFMKKNWRSDPLLPQSRENLDVIPRTETSILRLDQGPGFSGETVCDTGISRPF